MREKVRDSGRIQHILEAACILNDAISRYSLETIKNDRILFFGLSKLIEIIGEAAYKLTQEFKAAHPELPWKAIVGMRHVIVHDYYTMSPEKIWTTIVNDIPPMIPVLRRYLSENELDVE